MIAARLFALGGLALAAAMPASASTAEALAHCTSIDAPTARLACYDAAAGRTPSPTVAIEAPTAPTAAKARPVHSNDPQEFGLTPAQRKVEPSGPESIHARVAGIGGDGAGHAVVTLDNGQTWFIGDSDSRLDVGQEVTIKRAALGSFLMTTADRHSYRVRRTR